MFALIKMVTGVLCGILPDSPFRPYINKLGDFDFLGYLNWIIPFDVCMDITRAWAVAVFVYYNYDKIKKLLDKIISNIFEK